MSVSDLPRVGIVQPRFSYLRRLLLPVYGVDQAIFFTILVLVIGAAVILNSRLLLYVGIGGFIGAMVMMQASTPSCLLLPSASEAAIIDFLNAARLLRRSENNNEWVRKGGRLRRWQTDTIRLRSCSEGVLLTGREYDLKVIASRLAA